MSVALRRWMRKKQLEAFKPLLSLPGWRSTKVDWSLGFFVTRGWLVALSLIWVKQPSRAPSCATWLKIEKSCH